MALFTVTYDVVTHESAEQGDVADSGFYTPSGEQQSADDTPAKWTLRDVVSHFGRNNLTDCGGSFYSSNEENYRTGEQTSYAVHPPRTISNASYLRVRRVLADRYRTASGFNLR